MVACVEEIAYKMGMITKDSAKLSHRVCHKLDCQERARLLLDWAVNVTSQG